MNLGQALLSALDAVPKPQFEPASTIDTPRGRAARMRAIEKDAGGEKEAARAVGVQLRTWRAWKEDGARPVKASLSKLQTAAARVYRRKQRAALRRLLRHAPMPVVTAVVSWNGYITRTRYRTVHLDQMTGNDLTGLVDAWSARDTAALAAEFEAAVQDEYGDPVLFLENKVEVSLR